MIPHVRPALVLGIPCAFTLAVTSSPPRAPGANPPSANHTATRPSIDDTLALDAAGCAGVRATVWHPLSGLEYTGRLRITLPAHAGGALVLFVGDDMRLALEAEEPDGAPVPLRQEHLAAGPGVRIPPDFWLDDQTPWSAPHQITRVAIEALAGEDLSFTLGLGSRAPRVLARLAGYPAETRVPVCAAPVRAGEPYYATGWYGREPGAGGTVRWMRDYAAVLVASADGRAARVALRAAPAVAADANAATLLRLQVNDVFEAAAVPMRTGMADYTWDVPDEAWVAGTNELLFSVSRTTARGGRTLGAAVASITAR